MSVYKLYTFFNYKFVKDENITMVNAKFQASEQKLYNKADL